MSTYSSPQSSTPQSSTPQSSTPQSLPHGVDNPGSSYGSNQNTGYSHLVSQFAQQLNVSPSHNSPVVSHGPVNLSSARPAPPWNAYSQSYFQPPGQCVPRFNPRQFCFPVGGQRQASCVPGVVPQSPLFPSQRLPASPSGYGHRHSQHQAYNVPPPNVFNTFAQNTCSRLPPNVHNAPPKQGTHNPASHGQFPGPPHTRYPFVPCSFNMPSAPLNHLSYGNDVGQSSAVSVPGCKVSVNSQMPHTLSNQNNVTSTLNPGGINQTVPASVALPTSISSQPVGCNLWNSASVYQHSSTPSTRQPHVPNQQNWVQVSPAAVAAVSCGQSAIPSTQPSSLLRSRQTKAQTKKVQAQKHHRKNKAVTFWMERVKEWYPDRHTTTYFLPPQHFNRTQHSIEHVADQSVLVPEMPSKLSGGVQGPLYPTQTNPARSVSQVAGSVWTQPQGPSAPLPRYQETDVIDDVTTERVLHCIRVLSTRRQEVMMVISRLEFRKYLDQNTDPIRAADCPLFPRPEDKLGKQRPGECDLIVIHRRCGIIVGEIKSVGAAKANRQQLQQGVITRVAKAVNQLNNAADVLRHLISDVAPVPIIKTILLPNITSAELLQALGHDLQLEQDFCQCLGGTDVSTAVSRCLCADSMPSTHFLFSLHRPSPCPSPPTSPTEQFLKTDIRKPVKSSCSDSDDEATGDSVEAVCYSDVSDDDDDDDHGGGGGSDDDEKMSKLTTWWEGMTNPKSDPDPCMTDDVYDQLLARFCGPATTVEIPTVTAPRKALKGGKGFTQPSKVLRTAGQAVAETGLIMSTLTLYPQQVNILNDLSLHNVHLCGPPGTGKTLLLTLKAGQWLQQGHNVDIVQFNGDGRAVTLVIENQLKDILASGSGVTTPQVRSHNPFSESVEVVAQAASDLSALVDGDGRLFIVMDEVLKGAAQFLNELKARIPQLFLWCAGTSRLRNKPSWMSEQQVTVPLRCPPVVHREVTESITISTYRSVVPYSASVTPVPTDGPSVIQFQHAAQDGHTSAVFPEQCDQCGRIIADHLKKLGVGLPGADGLRFLDVLLLCIHLQDEVKNEKGEVTQPAMPMVQALRQEGIPVIVLTSESDDDVFCKVALAREDAVAVSTTLCVTGLERRVVVGMKSLSDGRMGAMSRCISQLIWIDEMSSN